MSTWFYYDSNGEKKGPVTGGQLKWLAKNGKITPGTMVQTEGGTAAPARKVKGLTFVEATPPQTSPPPPAAPNPFGTAAPAVPTNPFATATPPQPAPVNPFGTAAPAVSTNPFATATLPQPAPVNPFAAVAPPINQPMPVPQSAAAPVAEGSGGSSWQITIIGIVLILVVGFIGLAIIGVTSSSNEQGNTLITISATDLMRTYQENAVVADKTYRGKKFIVEGTIADIGANLKGAPYVTLKTDHLVASIQCFMRKNDAAMSSLRKGQSVRIEGRGDGMRGNVILSNCSVAQDAATPVQTGEQQGNAPIVKQTEKTYRDEQYGFSFRYPADWRAGPSVGGNVVLMPPDPNVLKTTKQNLQQA